MFTQVVEDISNFFVTYLPNHEEKDPQKKLMALFEAMLKKASVNELIDLLTIQSKQQLLLGDTSRLSKMIKDFERITIMCDRSSLADYYLADVPIVNLLFFKNVQKSCYEYEHPNLVVLGIFLKMYFPKSFQHKALLKSIAWDNLISSNVTFETDTISVNFFKSYLLILTDPRLQKHADLNQRLKQITDLFGQLPLNNIIDLENLNAIFKQLISVKVMDRLDILYKQLEYVKFPLNPFAKYEVEIDSALKAIKTNVCDRLVVLIDKPHYGLKEQNELLNIATGLTIFTHERHTINNGLTSTASVERLKKLQLKCNKNRMKNVELKDIEEITFKP